MLNKKKYYIIFIFIGISCKDTTGYVYNSNFKGFYRYWILTYDDKTGKAEFDFDASIYSDPLNDTFFFYYKKERKINKIMSENDGSTEKNLHMFVVKNTPDSIIYVPAQGKKKNKKYYNGRNIFERELNIYLDR